MRRNDGMIKENYKLDQGIRKFLKDIGTKEEIDAYFEHIYHCIGKEICAECGQAVDTNTEEYREEHVKEYSISGLCKGCQIKAFGE